MLSSFHSWLIRTEHGGRRQTILLDACSGNHKPRPWQPRFNQLDTPYMERLRAAGAQPEDIDIVLCTHLHADHVGWNTIERDGRWVPTFPNVRYLFSRTDADYWNQRSNPKMANDPRRVVYEDSILPVIETGQAVLVEGSHAIDDHLLIEPAPGHTPGLVILKMDLSGTAPASGANSGRALFCGDVIHHALQVYAPPLGAYRRRRSGAGQNHPQAGARAMRGIGSAAFSCPLRSAARGAHCRHTRGLCA